MNINQLKSLHNQLVSMANEIKTIIKVNNGTKSTSKSSGSLKKQQKELIISTLTKYKGNREQTAKSLGINVRTLYRRLKEYKIKTK